MNEKLTSTSISVKSHVNALPHVAARAVSYGRFTTIKSRNAGAIFARYATQFDTLRQTHLVRSLARNGGKFQGLTPGIDPVSPVGPLRGAAAGVERTVTHNRRLVDERAVYVAVVGNTSRLERYVGRVVFDRGGSVASAGEVGERKQKESRLCGHCRRRETRQLLRGWPGRPTTEVDSEGSEFKQTARGSSE